MSLTPPPLRNRILSLSAAVGGKACAVSHHVNQHWSPGPSHFFDWLILSLPALSQILSSDSHDLNMAWKPGDPWNNLTQTYTSQTLGCQSVHDTALSDYRLDPIGCQNRLEEKYQRRFLRLHDTLRYFSDIQCPIYLVRFYESSKDTSHQIMVLLRSLHQRYPQLCFRLILLTDQPNKMRFHRRDLYWISLNEKEAATSWEQILAYPWQRLYDTVDLLDKLPNKHVMTT